jgi:hypothetical protein
MNRLRKMSTALSALLALTITCLSLPMTAHGAMIGTQAVIAEQGAVDRALLVATLERADVQQQLVSLGVDVQQARERVAAMTDEELQTLNGKLKELPAGGDVIGAVVLIFLVLLITDIAGFTDIFPFVKKHRR